MEERKRAVFPLTPSESKRLIAKGVAALPEVQEAMARGRVIIATGTTNGFVAEELLHLQLDKGLFTAGVITDGALCTTPPERRLKPFVLQAGKPVDTPIDEFLRQFEAGDVFIKGASAIDPDGYVGVLVAGGTGGTIGMALGTLLARGAHLVVPVGLEKMIASVPRAARAAGTLRVDYSYGAAVGLIPVLGATVITEIEALRLLTGVEAVHIGSGGVGGSEGAVVLAVEGPAEKVEAAFNLVKSIKGEPPVPGYKRSCPPDCEYRCTFPGKKA